MESHGVSHHEQEYCLIVIYFSHNRVFKLYFYFVLFLSQIAIWIENEFLIFDINLVLTYFFNSILFCFMLNSSWNHLYLTLSIFHISNIDNVEPLTFANEISWYPFSQSILYLLNAVIQRLALHQVV